jgi:hypothetical protein
MPADAPTKHARLDVFATTKGGERKWLYRIVQRENGQIIVGTVNFRGQLRRLQKGPATLESAKASVTAKLISLGCRDMEFKNVE